MKFRDWFVPSPSLVQLVQSELEVERILRESAEIRVEEEKRRRMEIERERDEFRVSVNIHC